MNSKPFFSPNTYINRRNVLKKEIGKGQILILGNDESSSNFRDNWFPFRQDSSFLYFAGININGLALLIDAESGNDILFGNELNIDDIIWTGKQPSLTELAYFLGISKVLPLYEITKYLSTELAYLPTYRPEHQVKLSSWLNKPIQEIEKNASVPLIKAVAKQRNIKSADEIIQLDKVATITSGMHKVVMQYTQLGMYEHEVVAEAQKFLWENQAGNSFLPIATINGNVLHNHYYGNKITEDKMLLFDSGAELPNGYCGDMTRTIPAGKKFSNRQSEIYEVVYNAYIRAVSLLKPDVLFKEIHLEACKSLVDGLKLVGLMKGDTEEAVRLGAHAMFFQCGLGHLIGLDVHDMESLGEQYIGYSENDPKSTQFGLKSLRLGKTLEENNTLTIEPGIYIIPELIDLWKSQGLHKDFINYAKLETYKDFGGIRVEDAYAVTKSGSKLLGEPLAIKLKDVENLR